MPLLFMLKVLGLMSTHFFLQLEQVVAVPLGSADTAVDGWVCGAEWYLQISGSNGGVVAWPICSNLAFDLLRMLLCKVGALDALQEPRA